MREIKLPDLNDTVTTGGLLDGFLRRFAFGEVADGEDDLGGVEADKVAGCFEAEAGVAARHDDGLAGVFLCGVGWDGEELGAHECEGVWVGHL